jgi:hypothetical protein
MISCDIISEYKIILYIYGSSLPTYVIEIISPTIGFHFQLISVLLLKILDFIHFNKTVNM